ncbi:MAG TPA: DUF4398 domain-containing protein [Vicinamibacterales bacterium]|nr:DUF4398 domain-containing protein [Vicinamibacterales bacterium]
MSLSTWRAGGAGLVVALLAVSCAAPPIKELDQARNAITTARDAGAERFAPDEIAAADRELKLASQAVDARDYRLALNHALESREQAEAAAKSSTDTRTRLRQDGERSIEESRALIASTKARLDGPKAAQIPRRTRQAARQTLTDLENALQEADAALRKEDFKAAERTLASVKQRLARVVASLPKEPTAQSSRRSG